MESFLKRISFFLIYLPALIFACQFAYYSGLCEPLNIHIATLGLNYSEVAFLGYLNTSILMLENFTKLCGLILGFIGFILFAFILHWLAVHPLERKNEMHRIESFYYQFKYNLPKWKNDFGKLMDSFLGHFIIYFSIFLFTIMFILHYYEKGKNELIIEFDQIEKTTTCDYKEGYVIINSKNIRTKPMLCGNYKCYGIDLDNKEVFTYLPENYRRPLFLNDRIKR